MLRQFHYALVAAILIGTAPVAAQTLSKEAIQSTIQDQITAFKSDDFEAAFDFASRHVQQVFGSADRFGHMVEHGYPMVHRSKTVSFLEMREDGGHALQKVQVRDANGQLHHLQYHLIHNGDVWKINGVRLLELAGESA